MVKLDLDEIREVIDDWEKGMGSAGATGESARQLLDAVDRVLKLASRLEFPEPIASSGGRAVGRAIAAEIRATVYGGAEA